MTVDALHFVCKNTVAAEKAIESFRKFNPTSTYVVICDGGEDHSAICKKYNCEYIHSNKHIGYPQIPHGFYLPELTEYLNRFSTAVSMCKSSHILIMEDDVHIINNININPEDEMLVTNNCLGNYIHPSIVYFLSNLARTTVDNIYGMGGGSIFKKESFEIAYKKMKPIIDLNFEEMQKIYPTIGWTDCIISFILMGIGKRHKVNPQMHELTSWGQDYSKINYNNIDELYNKGISILHHYKKYYNF